jgi:hypothetical protein
MAVKYPMRPDDLKPEAARALFDAASFRLAPGDYPDENRLEMFHAGEWWKVGRTDLLDDVATGLVEKKTLEEWRKHYRAKIRYGARFHRFRSEGKEWRVFSVIDSLTDG